DAAAAVRLRDHQAEVGNVTAGRMLVAGHGQPSDDHAVVVGDEHRRIWIAPDRAQVAPLVSCVAPAVRRDEPALGLGAAPAAELFTPLRGARPRAADDHPPTPPAPPRRGSPAAASSPSSSVTAATPPKKRLRLRQRATFQPSCSSLSSSAGSWPPSQCNTSA